VRTSTHKKSARGRAPGVEHVLFVHAAVWQMQCMHAASRHVLLMHGAVLHVRHMPGFMRLHAGGLQRPDSAPVGQSACEAPARHEGYPMAACTHTRVRSATRMPVGRAVHGRGVGSGHVGFHTGWRAGGQDGQGTGTDMSKGTQAHLFQLQGKGRVVWKAWLTLLGLLTAVAQEGAGEQQLLAQRGPDVEHLLLHVR